MPENEPKMRRVRLPVENAENGLRLDLLLARRYASVARPLWQERIRDGHVLLDGRPARPAHRVRAGQIIEFVFVPKAEPPVNTAYRVLYRDDDLLCIDKPPDLPVHPSGVYREHTLYALLKRDFGSDFTVHLVHRIDRETSGLLLLAANPAAARTLGHAFQTGQVRKEYLTIVEGDFPERLDADGWLGAAGLSEVRKKRSFIRIEAMHPGPPGFQRARTEFHRVRARGGLSLVGCRLHTGRMHQIRATLRSLGYPVVGDRLYGVDETLYLKLIHDQETAADRARLRMGRTALHSVRLTLPHPVSGAEMRFEAALPDDMAALMPAT